MDGIAGARSGIYRPVEDLWVNHLRPTPLCVQVGVLQIHIGEVAPAVQEFSSKNTQEWCSSPSASMSDLQGAVVIYLFGQGSFNLHHGGPDWVCSSAQSFVACHAIISVVVGSGHKLDHCSCERGR